MAQTGTGSASSRNRNEKGQFFFISFTAFSEKAEV